MHTAADLYRRWLAERDEDAFAELARRHANLVYDVAWRTGADRGFAEDALQEALLRLATDGTEKPALVGVRAWLARLAISKARNARSSERARVKRERTVGARRMDDRTRGAKQTVEEALSRASSDDAAVLSLRFVHGLPYAELAAVLDVAESTARVKVHRALGRVREASSRDDLDESKLAGLLAAIPSLAAPSVAVEAAITAAVGASAAPVALAAASWLPRALVAVTLLAAVGAGLWWWAAERESPNDATSTAREPIDADAGTGTTLRGRPRATADAVVPTAAVKPAASSKAMPVPMPVARHDPPRTPDPSLVPLRARLVLVYADGTEEEIEIERVKVMYKGFVLPGAALETYADQHLVVPGLTIRLETSDRRAAFRLITARVPAPPEELVVRIPSKDHDGLDQLVLEVVDSRTGLPLPDAWLEWGSAESRHARVPADRNGRIPVRIPDSEECWAEDGEPTLWRFGCVEKMVRAPGYASAAFLWGSKECVPAASADDLRTWLERGVKRVALKPLPDGYVQRAVRILDADGRPAAGAYVLLVDPVHCQWLMSPLGAGNWNRRFRRADEDGRLSVDVYYLLGLQIRQKRVPVASWGLSAEAWPEQGPRVLRLPPIAEAELVVEDLPEGAGTWARSPPRPKRLLRDGNAFPMDLDPQTAVLMKDKDLALPMLEFDARGDLEPPTSTMRLPLPVGRSFTLHLGYDHQQPRTWTVRASEPGPLRLVRRWEDLPEAP